METLIGTLFGGLFRLAPEFIKWLDRKNERAHELSMFGKQIELDQLRATNALQQTKAEGEISIATKDIEALIAGANAQAVRTGIRWVDAINSLMRPTITFWWVIVLQTSVMVTTIAMHVSAGSSPGEALLKIWGTDEKAIVASIISYWFLDRTLRRGA